MAATLVLGTSVERRVGSSPTLGTILLASSSAAEPTTVNRLVAGSIPASPANIALVAQLVEHLLCNQDVRSSILLGGTILNTLRLRSRDNFILRRNRIQKQT